MPKMKQKAEATRTLAARMPLHLIKRVHHAAVDADITVQEFMRQAMTRSLDRLDQLKAKQTRK